MSTIEVKGTRSGKDDAPASRERYVFGDAEKLSKLPFLIGFAVTGLLTYLKSAMPSFGLARPDDAPALGPETQPITPTLEQLPALSAEPDEEQVAPRVGSMVYQAHLTRGAAIVDFRARPAVSEDAFHFRPTDPMPTLPAPANPQPARPQAPANDNGPVSRGPSPDVTLPDGIEAHDPGEDPEDDDPDTVAPDRRNRAPVSSGTLHLNDVMAGQMVLIGLSELLGGATDPDNDALTVGNVRVSSGSIGQVEGGWVYSSNRQSEDQQVVVTFEVSDGQATITRSASFRIDGKAPLLGTEGNDTLVGLATSDQIDGRGGDDIIDGSGGNDVILGGAGDDYILAGNGDDIVQAGAGNDVVFAGAGNDTVSGGAGNDRLHGEAGNDILLGDGGDDRLDGGAGDDHLDGGAGADTLLGGLGNDLLQGGSGNDTLHGEAGDDLIEDGAGTDVVEGGAGHDRVLAAMDGQTDSFDGGEGIDVLDLTQAEMRIEVDFAEGSVSGQETGADRIFGIETVLLGSGDDLVRDGAGSQTAVAGAGDDTVVVAIDAADDCFVGGEGEDVLDLSATTQGVVVHLSAGTAVGAEIGTDAIAGFETVIGGSGDDSFCLDATTATSSVTLVGGEGHDAFHFEVSASPQASSTELIHQILDFMVGDQVYVADYEFGRIRGEDGEEKFERIYANGGEGLDDDEFIVRLRNETTGEIEYAVIEVDKDRDGTIEFEVEIYSAAPSGHEQLTA